MWRASLTCPKPPLASAAISASSSVPMPNDTNAAWNVPTAFPSCELIGACSAMHPPTSAVSETASPRSTSGPPRDRVRVWSLGLQPRLADADVDGQRRVAIAPRREHLALDQRLDRVDLLGRALEEQLVVDGEDQPRPPDLVVERPGGADHRQLDHVGRRALDRRVDGEALAERPHPPVARLELGDLAAAAEQRRHVAALRGLLDRARDELADLREDRKS